MSELKCPFCQQEVKIAGEHTTIMSCYNGDCKGSGLYGEKEFWQELISTRKALDKAKNGLKELKDIIACPPDVSYETCVSMYADGVLQEITALEQKDHFADVSKMIEQKDK